MFADMTSVALAYSTSVMMSVDDAGLGNLFMISVDDSVTSCEMTIANYTRYQLFIGNGSSRQWCASDGGPKGSCAAGPLRAKGLSGPFG